MSRRVLNRVRRVLASDAAFLVFVLCVLLLNRGCAHA
jgi:hypothetical protein